MKEKKETSIQQENISEPEDFLDLIKDVKKDEAGIVRMENVLDKHPEILKNISETARMKQKMIIESITAQDVIGANLREKAISSKALHEQAMELETGIPAGTEFKIVHIETNVVANKG